MPPLISFLCLWYLLIPETRLHTPNDYNYKHWFEADPDRNCVEFLVKAHNDAHIALGSDQLHDGKHWEIVIGGWANRQSVIRKRNQGAHVRTYVGRPLNQHQYQPFWIEWDEDGDLRVGSGRVSEGMRHSIFSCTFDKKLPIKYMSVCTGWGSTGDWIIFG